MSCTINFKLVVQGFGMGGVISSYKPTTTLQTKVLGFVWCKNELHGFLTFFFHPETGQKTSHASHITSSI